MPTDLSPVEPTLNIKELYRLVKIAHEAGHGEIRSRALQLLDRALNPAQVYRANS